MNVHDFQSLIWQKGNELFREMPWRTSTNPYYVLVSELMLQQTQVDRVIPKFEAFIAAFPTIQSLAEASLAEVLTLWSGLGYNRRAKFLHMAAQATVANFGGQIPQTLKELVTLPGVGPNTAGAIMAYSFNQPVDFIETNIRTVYFYHFFPDSITVSDAELKEKIAETADTEHPREWYWAMMDYGSWLKRQGYGANNKSAHYKKQAPLKGSLREMRGMLLKILSKAEKSYAELTELYAEDPRYTLAMQALLQEGLIQQSGDTIHLPKPL
jgi:A/G-specific adenine glycosylase